MHLIKPEKRACYEKIRNFFATIIENSRLPMSVHPFSGVFMLIKRRSVKPIERVIVDWEVSRNPIEDYTDFFLMHMIDKILKISRCTIATRDRKKPRYLIPP